jgi:hypothetical protein
MPRDPESLIDIAAAIRRILRYTDGISRVDLEANDEKLSAILYQITIIMLVGRRSHPYNLNEKGRSPLQLLSTGDRTYPTM